MDAGLKRELEAKVYEGARLTRTDGEALSAVDDLAWLGRLAHHRRTQLHGDRVTFGPGTDVAVAAGGFDEVLATRDRGVTVFVPTPLRAPAESLRAFAVARLLLDDVPHLRCPWEHGPSVAQLVLNFGADDLDGLPGGLSRDDLVELIRDAGFRPVERDARFGVVHEFDPPVPLAERRSEPQKVWA